MRSGITLASTLLATLPAAAQIEMRRTAGEAPGDYFGFALAAVGDVDGDGRGDLAVGAPLSDVSSADSGRVTIYSGRTGQVLRDWGGAAGRHQFGHSLAAAGDVDGDGAADVLVGAGTYLGSWWLLGTLTPGYVRLMSGASGAVLLELLPPANVTNFGYAVATGLDVDGDGVEDVLVGAPGSYFDAGAVYVYSGANGALLRTDTPPNGTNFGLAIAVVGDIDGDGKAEYAVGAPFAGNFGSADDGWVHLLDGATGTPIWSRAGVQWEQLGWSLATLTDLDSDGVRELIVGAPSGAGGFLGCVLRGRVHILSGATGALLRTTMHSFNTCGAYGSAVSSLADLDGDGVEDYVGGQSGWEAGFDPASDLRLYSGASGALLATVELPTTAANTAFGFALASGDVTGDGLADLSVSAPWDDENGANSGVVHVYTVVRAPRVYCESEPNSLGCTPAIGWSGIASASSPQAFAIGATNLLNSKSGLLFYGFKPRQTPFQGGAMCVVAPTTRTPLQSSGGSTPPAQDCSGALSFDFNARIQSGVDPRLTVGAEVFAQYWSRDPADASHTNLSNALAFHVGA
jgi:hypothetical protein